MSKIEKCIACQNTIMQSSKECLCGIIYYCSDICREILDRAIGKHSCDGGEEERDMQWSDDDETCGDHTTNACYDPRIHT